MKVRMKEQLTGSRNGKPWPAPGETIEVFDSEAVDLINSRVAEAVTEQPKPEKRPTAKRAETRKA